MSRRSALEAREIVGALSEAARHSDHDLALLKYALEDNRGALQAALEHITILERENTKLRRLTAELAAIGGR